MLREILSGMKAWGSTYDEGMVIGSHDVFAAFDQVCYAQEDASLKERGLRPNLRAALYRGNLAVYAQLELPLTGMTKPLMMYHGRVQGRVDIP